MIDGIMVVKTFLSNRSFWSKIPQCLAGGLAGILDVHAKYAHGGEMDRRDRAKAHKILWDIEVERARRERVASGILTDTRTLASYERPAAINSHGGLRGSRATSWARRCR